MRALLLVALLLSPFLTASGQCIVKAKEYPFACNDKDTTEAVR